MTQLRADVAAKLLLSAGFTTSSPTDGSTDPSRRQHRPNGTTANSRHSDRHQHRHRGRQQHRCTARRIDDAWPAWLPVTDGVDAGPVPSPAAQVLVTVPVFALMGLTDEPATLDGYGPIPPPWPGKLVADGAVLVPPGPDRPPRRGAAGDRTDQLPDHHSPSPMAATAGRQMPVPRLQQPVPGQRSRPHPRLGRRRHHRHQQPRPAVPQTPPTETHHRLDTHRRHQRRTTRLDLTHRPPLQKRTPGLGTTPLATQSRTNYAPGMAQSCPKTSDSPAPCQNEPLTRCEQRRPQLSDAAPDAQRRPCPKATCPEALPQHASEWASIPAVPKSPFEAGGFRRAHPGTRFISKMTNPDKAAQATAYWTTGPQHGELRAEDLPAPGPGEALVRTLYSGISKGTEIVVHTGSVPPRVARGDARAAPGGLLPFPREVRLPLRRRRGAGT